MLRFTLLSALLAANAFAEVTINYSARFIVPNNYSAGALNDFLTHFGLKAVPGNLGAYSLEIPFSGTFTFPYPQIVRSSPNNVFSLSGAAIGDPDIGYVPIALNGQGNIFLILYNDPGHGDNVDSYIVEVRGDAFGHANIPATDDGRQRSLHFSLQIDVPKGTLSHDLPPDVSFYASGVGFTSSPDFGYHVYEADGTNVGIVTGYTTWTGELTCPSTLLRRFTPHAETLVRKPIPRVFPPLIDIDTTAQKSRGAPNLLLYGDGTTLDITVFPAASGSASVWDYYGLLSQHIITTAFTGQATVLYITGTNMTAVDVVSATACTSVREQSGSVNVYNLNASLDDLNTVPFTFHQSLVDDTKLHTYADPTFTATDINNFFIGKGSFLRNFYSVDLEGTGQHLGDGGWIDINGDGIYQTGEPVYCFAGTVCPVAKDVGISAADLIVRSAARSHISERVIITKLQVEQGLIARSSKPSDGMLDAAGGCRIGSWDGFYYQILCIGDNYRSLYTTATTAHTYPYFFPVSAVEKAVYPGHVTRNGVVQSIQYEYGSSHCDALSHTGCALVGFEMKDAATEIQYHYTPFVQTDSKSSWGGVRAFDYWWFRYFY